MKLLIYHLYLTSYVVGKVYSKQSRIFPCQVVTRLSTWTFTYFMTICHVKCDNLDLPPVFSLISRVVGKLYFKTKWNFHLSNNN